MKKKYSSDFEESVRNFCSEFGGNITNAHTHGDRAYTWRDDYYAHTGKSLSELPLLSLREKQKLTWALHGGPAFERECIEERMTCLIEESVRFGVRRLYTTVDVTYNTRLKSLEVAESLKEKYKDKLELKIGAYNPSGFRDSQKERFEIFEEACKRADFIVGLAEKDRAEGHIGEHQHNWYLLRLAHEYGKPLQFHVGQENRATDVTLEILLGDIEKFQDYHHRISPDDFPRIDAVHAISLSCRSEEDFDRTVEKMKQRNVGLICCPRAAISMLQDRSMTPPTHNSIARVWDMASKGIRIGVGVDNVNDIFVPASSANLYEEAEYLANSLRIYLPRMIAKILCREEFDDFDIGTIKTSIGKRN
jgi:cytosine/creatinine deaminase